MIDEQSSGGLHERNYVYTDNFDVAVYRKVRRDQPKSFFWEHLNSVGLWTTGLGGSTRYLYGLVELIASLGPVWLPEGEKDVDTLSALGLTATTSGGTSDPWLPEFDEYLARRDVIILTDNDAPGWNRGNDLAEKLGRVAKSVRIVSFTGTDLPEHGDVTDWLEAGHTREELEALAAATPKVERDERASTGTRTGSGSNNPPQSATIPDMPESVLSGRLGEVCQRMMGNFPRAYAWPAIVTCAGTFVVGTALRSNLFAALVGPVGSGKSQAIERAMRALGIDPRGDVPPVMDLKAGSGEGLLKAIGDVAGGARLYSMDELGHLLEKSQIQNSSFPHILNSLFYSSYQKLRIARGEAIEFSCCLSILGGLLEETFGDLFGKSTTGGLYDRFIFGQCPTGFSYSYRPFEGKPLTVEPVTVAVSPEVWDESDSWIKTIPGVTGRIAEIALRVAAICASWDGKEMLTVSDIGPARAFAEHQAQTRNLLRPNPGENFEARAAFKFLAYLQRHAPNGEWVGKRQMLRNTRAYELGPSIANKALCVMAHNGDVEEKQEGRKSFVRMIP